MLDINHILIHKRFIFLLGILLIVIGALIRYSMRKYQYYKRGRVKGDDTGAYEPKLSTDTFDWLIYLIGAILIISGFSLVIMGLLTPKVA